MFNNIPKSLLAISFASMFWSMSSFMVISLLPFFMIEVLHGSTKQFGYMEGIAVFSAFLTKCLLGFLSDYVRNRKIFVTLGAIGSIISKVIFVFSGSIGLVFFARSFDRLAKGIRAAPTQAIVGDISPKKEVGKSYGIWQSLYSMGNVLGGILASFLMHRYNNNYKLVFWFAVIPAALALLLVIFLVEHKFDNDQKQNEQLDDKAVKKISGLFLALKSLPKEFFFSVMISSLFYLGARFSTSFLNIRARECFVPVHFIPILYSLFELSFSLSVWPIGILSDKIGKKNVLIFGTLILMIANLVLFMAKTPLFVIFGIILWGLHLGATEGIFSVLIGTSVSQRIRGTAFSIFYFVSGVAIFIADAVAGTLSDYFKTTSMVFLASFVMTIIILIMLIFLYEKKLKK